MRREELADLIRPVLDEEGFELVECSISRTTRSQTFRVFIDREEGVPVEACARISRRIALLVEANPMLRGAYQLEVSSAGMNRPIWKPEHFLRFQGEKVRIELASGEPRVVLGTIGLLEKGGIWIRLPGGEDRFLPLSEVTRAQLHMDPWRKPAANAAKNAPDSPGASRGTAARVDLGTPAREGTDDRNHGQHGD